MFADLPHLQVSLPVLALLSIASVLILLSRSWRLMLAALVVQYLGVFVLVALIWPITLALVKLVAGSMACTILAAALWNAPQIFGEEHFAPSGRLFRLLMSGLVFIAVFSSSAGAQSWLPGISILDIWTSLLLIGMGMLNLSLTANPIRATIGLLTIYSGFEIIYAVVENSVLVAGLLAMLTIGVAVIGAYLSVVKHTERVGK